MVIPRKPVGSPVSQFSHLTIDNTEDSNSRPMRPGNPAPPNRAHAPSAHSALDEKRSDDNEDESLSQAQYGSSVVFSYAKVANELDILESKHNEMAEASAVEHTKQLQRRRFNLQLGAWWQETGCCLLAFALLFGLIILLRRYDNTPGPDSLNTIVAIIATTCRALTVIPIAEGLSQLKWNSFARGQRPLKDLYAFDQASRGPLGSIMLLLRTRGRLLAVSTFAAAILVSGLATSSLTQATISVVPRPERQIQDAVVRKVNAPYQDFDGMKKAAYSAVLMREENRRDLLYQQVEPRCPVGDCRWEPFNSLGICVAMRNITDGLEIHTMDYDEALQMDDLYEFTYVNRTFYNITLASDWGDYCTVFDTGLNVRGLLAACGGVRYAREDQPVPGIAILAQNYLIYKPFETLGSYSEHPSYQALEINWHWCVQRYNVSVSAGVPRTAIVGETFDLKEADYFNMTITDADQKEDFEVEQIATLLMFRGNWSDIKAEKSILLSSLESRMYGEHDGYEKNVIVDRLNELARDMALGMTNNLRFNKGFGTEIVQGYASTGLIIIVRWRWLSLLGSQVLLTAVFLLYVIVDTVLAGVGVVKSSNMAELMVSKKGNVRTVDGPDGMDLVAGGIASKVYGDLRGRLVRESAGWHLDIQRQDLPGEKGLKGKRWFV